MTEKLTKAYVTTNHRIAELAQKRESGQGALEYIGILAVVVVVIGLAIAGFNAARPQILEGVKNLVEDVTSVS